MDGARVPLCARPSSDEAGTFELSHVAPGAYELITECRDSGGRWLRAKAEFDVEDGAPARVDLTIDGVCKPPLGAEEVSR